MKKLVYFIFFMNFLNKGLGQVTNLTSGLWSNSAIWSNNHVPESTDSVFLSADLIVDINGNCRALNQNGHTLTVNPGIIFNIIGNNVVAIDIDNTVYHTVTIDTQVWIKENVTVSRYRNGDTIPQVTDSAQWILLTTGAWCWYKNDSATYAATYGKLYNWYAVTDPRGLAPQGWHMPRYEEWAALANYLGDYSSAGGKMKEAGNLHWQGSNVGATNSSGFTAIPSGYRNNGSFSNVGLGCYFWSTAPYSPTNGYANYLTSSSIELISVGIPKIGGYSVRCIKD